MKRYQEIHFESVDSTNLYIKHHYLELDDFTFVSSDYQSEGKGRYDRVWKSQKGENLLFSLLIKEKYLVAKGGYLSLVAAVSVSELLDKYGFKNITIKWPNDVYINDKKVCGILLEGQIPEYIVIGIGINVNQKDFIGEYHATPTSLILEGGKEVVLHQFKRDMFDILIKNISNIDLLHHQFKSYFHKHNHLDKKEIKFLYDGEYLIGTVKGIDDNFNLIVTSNNKEIKVSSGEISIL
ncbi:MAG: biotin--[acetyl-CoA-carboxylase] ligase [Bacilli bacterium]|nr:biotin--[acetyl-CoA-carboxylase] ligase [Bacilli bacterium]